MKYSKQPLKEFYVVTSGGHYLRESIDNSGRLCPAYLEGSTHIHNPADANAAIARAKEWDKKNDMEVEYQIHHFSVSKVVEMQKSVEA